MTRLSARQPVFLQYHLIFFELLASYQGLELCYSKHSSCSSAPPSFFHFHQVLFTATKEPAKDFSFGMFLNNCP
jgi:hypothetical protein